MTATPMPVTLMVEACLYRLLAWLSPGFPIGAFSYSHGLETAVERGRVADRMSLESWITAIIAQGTGRVDADILRDAYRAAIAGDVAALVAAKRRGLAFRAAAELALEARGQGEAFLAACRLAWGVPLLDRWAAALDGEPACYAAAFGAAAGAAGIPLSAALAGYLQALAANLISAGLRLGVIGQTDGQHILAALEPIVLWAAAATLDRDDSEFGSAAVAADLAAIAHETQRTRLFRS
jgi:urease accessory protein